METNVAIKKLLDPKFYLENFCRIKGKKPGQLAPFILNEAQKDLFNTIKNNSRIIILKARQLGFCGSPDTKILNANLEWITLRDVNEGDLIVSVDEFPKKGRGNSRKMRTAIVNKKYVIFEQAFKLKMDDGRELIFTGNHRLLSKKNGSTETVWKNVKDFKVGNEIRYITKPWEKGNFEDGWFGGIIDGEGSLRYKNHSGAEVCAAQRVGPLLEKMELYSRINKYNFKIESDARKNSDGNTSKYGNQVIKKIVFNRMDEVFRVIGQTRPKRFKGIHWWEGKDLPGKRSGIGWSKIVTIELLEKQEMIDLQTSTKTYIAEGFVSHNSTAVTGYFYHNTITTPGTTTALIGYNSDLTSELLDKVKTLYKTTPEDLRPTIHYNSKFEISFPSIDSKILVLPSTENVGRGYTLSNCLCTELASWRDAEEKMMALEASVPIDGKLIIESTPNGQGNLFHRMWMMDNDYAKKEYGWWWGYTKDQIDIIRRRMRDPRRFAQEYGLEFLASGRSVFDINVIKEQRENILRVNSPVNEDNSRKVVYEKDNLRIYKEPQKDGMYVCGVDVSEGVADGDYSVATIWNRKSGEEVAMYRGLIPPDLFANKLNRWGREYNNALMVVEINNHGLTTVTVLKQLLYPTLYFRPSKFETMDVSASDKMGWKTTKMTRPLLIDDFAQACRDKELIIHSKELLDEMSVFVYDDAGNMTPQSGFNDDTIFSAAIAIQGFKVMCGETPTQIEYENYLPKTFTY